MKGNSTTKFIGLDVHSKTISVAIADEGRDGEVRHYVYPLHSYIISEVSRLPVDILS